MHYYQNHSPVIGLYKPCSNYSFGEVIIWLEEFSQVCYKHNIVHGDVLIISDEDRPDKKIKIMKTIELINAFKIVRNVIQVRNLKEAKNLFNFSKSSLIWPKLENVDNYNCDTTLRIRNRWENKIPIVPLKLRSNITDWALKTLKNSGPPPWISVHLKNSPSSHCESNAKVSSWLSLFKYLGHDQCTFFLVGDDETSNEIKRLPNVRKASEFKGKTLAGYLALVQNSHAFMGMMSGICNIALFGKKPYSIFKNPHHHKLAMFQEIGDSDFYSFSNKGQKVIRKTETFELLCREFYRLNSEIEMAFN